MRIFVTIISLLFNTGSVMSQDLADRVMGRWVGTFGNTVKDNPYYFSFEFLPGGNLNVINQNDKILATGTFAMHEDTIKITYRYINDIIQFSCKGALDKRSNELYGTWQRIEDAGRTGKFTQQGRWTMSKKSANPSVATKTDTPFLNFTDRKNITANNKKNFIQTNIQYCVDLPPVTSRPLPARVPTNYLTEYEILPDGSIRHHYRELRHIGRKHKSH